MQAETIAQARHDRTGSGSGASTPTKVAVRGVAAVAAAVALVLGAQFVNSGAGPSSASGADTSASGGGPAGGDGMPPAGGAGAPPEVGPSGSAEQDVERLEAGTRRAFRAAQAAAREDGVELLLTSGRRTAAEQQALYDAAIVKYGSPRRASRWVLPPEKSQHVRGVAVDVRPREAAAWLERNGSRFGLCRTYGWEWWHFEHRGSFTTGCPAPRSEGG